MIVLLDTNFLLIPGQTKYNPLDDIGNIIQSSFKLKTLECIAEELEEMSKRRGKDGMAARLALSIIKARKIEVLKIRGIPDQEIVKYARKHRCAVCTQDRRLRQKLLKLSVPVIYLRGRKTLSLFGYIP